MNSPVRRLSLVVSLLFALLLGSLTWVQFVNAKTLQDKPGNRRTLLATFSRDRGAILVGSTPVARSVPSKDDYLFQRTYPQGDLYSHITGYYSFLYGSGGGIEGSQDSLLSGSSDALFYRRMVDLVSGKRPAGASVELTINPAAQRAADQALGNQRGAVVALDPRTGAILAMVSHPTYDPTALATHNLQDSAAAWKSLNANTSRPLDNRAIAGRLYPPGSVFKLVTAAAALDSGKFTESSMIPGPASLDLPQTSVNLHNDFAGSCGGGDKVTLTRALQISCNTAFGWLGLNLGAQALRDQAAKFGFGQALRVPMPVTPSVVPAQLNPPQTAQSAIGQYDVRVTPLQVAMVAAAIANGGQVMQPHLVKAVRAPDLSVIDQPGPISLGQAMSGNAAAQLTRMMQAVVNAGTGTEAQISGISVAGKTGTAQQGPGKPPHAWFTAFAPAANPRIAVAVVVEDGGKAGNEAYGGKIAAPIAKQVIEAVLGL
jgi:peptidoglycan glycosyltransferase